MKHNLPWLLMLAAAAALVVAAATFSNRQREEIKTDEAVEAVEASPAQPARPDKPHPVRATKRVVPPFESQNVVGGQPEESRGIVEAPRQRQVEAPLPRRAVGGDKLRAPPRRFSLDESFSAARERTVNEQIAAAGRNITNPDVLNAMRTVLRHQFTPALLLAEAYEDKALNIDSGRVMESPYVVASVAELSVVSPTDRVLAVNTDYGYQAAVLSFLAKEVYTLDSQEVQAEHAWANFEYGLHQQSLCPQWSHRRGLA